MKYFDQFFGFLRNLNNEELAQFFKNAQISELMHTPYFLGTVAVIILVCMYMKWRLLLSATIAIVGFAELLAYTTAQETSLSEGLNNESLFVFIGGSAIILAFVIYLLFIKSE
jgi:hypothetical protein